MQRSKVSVFIKSRKPFAELQSGLSSPKSEPRAQPIFVSYLLAVVQSNLILAWSVARETLSQKKQSVVPIGLATNSLGIPDGKSIQASQLEALTAVALITASGPKWSAESVKAQKDCGTAHLFFRLNPVSCERNASLHLAGWV